MSNHAHAHDVNALAAAFRGIADPYRLRVFITLLQMSWEPAIGSGGAYDLADAIEEISYSTNMAPPLAEHHVMELKRAGLVDINEGANGRLTIAVNTKMLASARHVVGENGSDGGDREG